MQNLNVADIVTANRVFEIAFGRSSFSCDDGLL